MEEILPLPLAGDVDHETAASHAVRGQAWDEGLEGLELGGSNGKHVWLLSEIVRGLRLEAGVSKG